jgi:hypothetical protein
MEWSASEPKIMEEHNLNENLDRHCLINLRRAYSDELVHLPKWGSSKRTREVSFFDALFTVRKSLGCFNSNFKFLELPTKELD